MTAPHTVLRRELGAAGAVLLGLGSMVGAGLFLATALGAALAGSAVLLALTAAATVAWANGTSSARLAAVHPVAGGTYEYGYRLLHPALGFSAGWMFLCAKGASAATAALGLAAHLERLFDVNVPAWAWAAAATLLVWAGLRPSRTANAVLVGTALLGLLTLVIACWWAPPDPPAPGTTLDVTLSSFLHASALMFVAFTGYGRVATLGEEVRDPARTIPRAVAATIAATLLLYLAVTGSALHAVGAEFFAAHADDAPLEAVAERTGWPWSAPLVALAAFAALGAVLLNLVLGLSRMALAMGRRGDLPGVLARVDRGGRTPVVAVPAVGVLVAGLTLTGGIETTWTLSAFTVLVYYAITNLAALRLPGTRTLPRLLACYGLAACLLLAAHVPILGWGTGLAVLAVGHLLRLTLRARPAAR